MGSVFIVPPVEGQFDPKATPQAILHSAIEPENTMHADEPAAPDSTAVRVALWRATHVQVDPPPRVLEDEIGLRLAAPDAGWRQRPDMDPQGTRGYRAGVVGRARFIGFGVREGLRPTTGESFLVASC
jgi:hypothetical protein